MKTNYNRSLESAELLPGSTSAPKTFSSACRATLENLKNTLVQRLSSEFSDLQERLVRQAVNDAHALAALTEVPHLLLPALAEEKVQSARQWNAQQQAILNRSSYAFAA